LFEFAAEAVATEGSGAAMESIKAGSLGAKAAKVAETFDKAVETVKTVGGKLHEGIVEKLPKPIKGIFGKGAEEGVEQVEKKLPSYIHGADDGGPGTWEHRTFTSNEGAAEYQEFVTGAPKDTEYVVKVSKEKMPSGEKKFDGYDPETNTLLDAKDWKIGKKGWPPEGQDWAAEKVAKEAQKDANIAKEANANLEWHVPSEDKKIQLQEIFNDYNVKGVKIVVKEKIF